MSLYTFSAKPTNSTNADFRAWGSAISTGIPTVGWVKTNDTGQIDWVNVLAPTATNTFQGYEIWRMDDTLQATHPVFMKIEYGSGASNSYPAIAVTVGTGSDGAGNLTGQIGTRTLKKANSADSYALHPGFISGAPNRLVIAAFCGQNGTPASYSYSLATVIERSHDASGEDTSAGIMCLMGSYGSGTTSQFIAFEGAVQPSYSDASVCGPPTGSGARGSDIHVYPARCWTPGESSPFLGAHGYFIADLTTAQAVPVATWSGQTVVTLPLGDIINVGYPSSMRLALRYE